MKDATPIIVIDDLHARYGNVNAVNGVSLQIQRGECFGLLGPNGAGKTTLLSCLEGIKKFHQGSITIDGIDVTKAASRTKRLLGVQLQDASLFPDLNAIEIIQFYGALYNVFPTRQQALDLLKRFDLADKAKARIEQLSGGQKQRLTLALSIVHSPSILLLDEPTTGLDPQARRQIWGIVRQLRGEGATIILTTHYIEEAEILCQRVGIINQGRIIALGSPQELVARLGKAAMVLATVILPDEKIRIFRDSPLVQSLNYDHTQLTFQSSEPQQALALLERLTREEGTSAQNVVVRQPDLEDVFLTLAGRPLVEQQ